MRLLVFGGRDFTDRPWLFAVLDVMFPSVTIHGKARGADSLADEWARARGVAIEAFAAEWDRYGRRAGYLRNVRMADALPDIALGFPGDVGTKMMIEIARARNIPTVALSK